MRRLDVLHREQPFAESRMLRDLLRCEGLVTGRDRVRTLMRRMGITAIYRRPRTSEPHPTHAIFPYLLRGLTTDRPNRVWATDITYIPMPRGFVSLCAIMDWASRKVMAWRVAATLTADFCAGTHEEAIDRFGALEMFNMDPGLQFTSEAFATVLRRRRIQVTIEGRGGWRDNVFVERVWRSAKCADVHLRASEPVGAVRADLKRYFTYFGRRHPQTPAARRITRIGLHGRTRRP